jgi:hypothetical protein
VPIQFLRVLWDALFPSRFQHIVLEGIDGTPPPGFARPLTFCLGCWLLFYGVAKVTPWAFSASGAPAVLRELPPADRDTVMRVLGLDTVRGVVVADTGPQPIVAGTRRAIGYVNERLGKRFGRPTASEFAAFLESHGKPELGLRLRGYASRLEDRPTPFSETSLVFFVVFGLVPGWWVSHKVLASPRRTFRETRAVHMYSDAFLVAYMLVPLSVATWAGLAFASSRPQEVVTVIGIAAFVYWIWSTLRIYRVTQE